MRATCSRRPTQASTNSESHPGRRVRAICAPASERAPSAQKVTQHGRTGFDDPEDEER